MNGEEEGNNLSSSPFLFSNYVYKWLDTSLDYGIKECEFWNMTLAEIVRAIESKKRIQRLQQQEQATFDYALADLIGRSISRIYSSTNQMPKIADVYPSLFDSEEIEEQMQKKRDELSALRFKKFAQAYNKNREASKNK